MIRERAPAIVVDVQGDVNYDKVKWVAAAKVEGYIIVTQTQLLHPNHPALGRRTEQV